MKALRELEDKRNRVLREYSSWADDNAHFYEDSRSTRRELWAGVASDEDSGWETYSEEIEEVLSEAEVFFFFFSSLFLLFFWEFLCLISFFFQGVGGLLNKF